MGRKQASVTLLAVGLLLAPSGSAAARTTGRESFKGTVIASGASGTRPVVSSLIVARGVFNGVGRVVEVENRSGDPDNVSRDELVFPAGAVRIRNSNQPPKLSLDPQTCAYTVSIKQTTRVQGGTGTFRHAEGRFAGAVHAWGVAARNADGACSQEADPLLEAATVSARGTLTY